MTSWTHQRAEVGMKKKGKLVMWLGWVKKGNAALTLEFSGEAA